MLSNLVVVSLVLFATVISRPGSECDIVPLVVLFAGCLRNGGVLFLLVVMSSYIRFFDGVGVCYCLVYVTKNDTGLLLSFNVTIVFEHCMLLKQISLIFLDSSKLLET